MSQASFKSKISRALLRLPAWLLALSPWLAARAIMGLDQAARGSVVERAEAMCNA